MLATVSFKPRTFSDEDHNGMLIKNNDSFVQNTRSVLGSTLNFAVEMTNVLGKTLLKCRKVNSCL